MSAPISRGFRAAFGNGKLASKLLPSSVIHKSNHGQCSARQILQYTGHFHDGSIPFPQPRRHMCYEARNVDITAGKQPFLFDTHECVKNLTASGATESEAEAIVNAMVAVMHSNMDYMSKNMVTKPQQEIMMQQIMSMIGTIRKDMIILEKSEFSSLKHEYEKQAIELQQLRQTLQDEVTKLKSGMSLDMNLERSRSTESHAENEKKLVALHNRIEIDQTEISKQFSILDNRIAKDIANLMATYERYKNDVMKYTAGATMTCLTICLGFYRLWS